ncbi:c-type cytochrome [Bradyrhizobium sp.]|uniref:c-type cytochrome n=1 Tax=Bradyrhizobium sp. TaxID=376 RepID=UPI003C77EE3B
MMIFGHAYLARALLACIIGICFSVTDVAHGQSAGTPDPTDAGKAIFKRANCMGCHKWHGNGGGGYGGDALSLRKTELTRELIIETIGCGRPGTGMPFFLRGAYDTIKCYGALQADMAGNMPPEAGSFLRGNDIEAVADYVLAHIKGRSEPTYAECIGFFSQESRACNVYKTDSAASPENKPKER